MGSMEITKTTDGSFERDVVKNEKPTIVGFHAPWSGPSTLIDRSLNRVREQFGDFVDIVTVNVDENPLTAHVFAVETLPSFLLFKHGTLIQRVHGAVPDAVLQDLCEEAIVPDT